MAQQKRVEIGTLRTDAGGQAGMNPRCCRPG